MSRNHTFLTRGLAVVMALVMIVSCANLGLALPALAADNGESLYALIEKSDVGTPALRAVLAAGGLPGDQIINYSEPTEADAEDLLTLKGGILTAESYDSGIEGASWVPYSYGAEGSENLFTGTSAEWTEETVNVIYALNLGSDIVAEPLEMAAELADEAGVQNAILRNFYDTYQDNLKSMRKSVLNGLKDEVEYAPAPAEVKADFVAVIDALKGLINNETGYLNFYHTLESYQTEGLAYYYANWQLVVSQISELSTHMNALVETQEKLDLMEYMCDSLGYAGYTEKFVVLADALVEASSTLKAPNSKIDLTNEKLVSALDLAMGVQNYETKDLVLYSTNLYVLDSTYAYVIVTVTGPNGYKTVPVKFENGGLISAEEVYAQVEATAASLLGDKAPYYTLDASAVDALGGKIITENVNIECTWNEAEYTVKINNVADQTVTINGLTITLPGHPEEGHEYIYFIGDSVVIANKKDMTHTFTAADLDNMFVDGVLVIERQDHNYYRDGLEGLVASVNEKVGKDNAFVLTEGEEGDYIALTANIEMGDLAAFAEAVILSDYTYIALNNEVFYDGEYVSVQSLINALLNDDEFSNETLIALGQNGNGQFLHTTMQLAGYDLDFVLNLTSVPAEMTKVSKALNAVKDYMYFNGGEGYLDVTMTLPEKVYEGYLTAAIGTGYANSDNLDSFKNMATVQFVADYFELLMNSDVTTTTFSNTLATVGIERDLSAYEDYYQKVKKIANGNGFDYVINDSMVDVDVAGNSENIETVLNMLGLNSAMMRFGTSLIKEETLSVCTTFTLTNDAGDFEALVINPAKVTETGAKNKINAVDYTSNLIETLSTMKGKSMVILLDDVYGSLNFPASAVIDLNGQTVHGDINVNGSVVIVDSAMVTYNGGTVKGTVNAVRGAVTGGTYNDLDAKFLRDGYSLDNGSVRNGFYYVVKNNGAFEFVLNADFYNTYNGYLPSVAALATEISVDLALNYYPAAALAYGSEYIYNVNIDNILTSYVNGNPVDAAISDMCGSVYASGINALANDIIDDLCDLKAMSAALENGTALCNYKFTMNPLCMDFNYIADGDYLDFGLTGNKNVGKSFGIALAIEGNNKYFEYTKDLIAAMSEILTIDAQVELYQPTYVENGNILSVGGNGYTDVTLDLSGNSDYTKGLAIILAYGNPEWADEIANAKNCVVVLNKIMAQMTVNDVFTALKEMNRETSMTEMADAIGYKYSAKEMQDLEAIYHNVLCGIGKFLEVLHIDGNSYELSAYENGVATYTYGRTSDAYGDATVAGFTGICDITYVSGSFTIKMAPKCTRVLGDADWDGIVTTYDAALILEYMAELISEYDLHLCVSDVDGDGAVTTFDAACILEYKAELIDRFPAEEN